MKLTKANKVSVLLLSGSTLLVICFLSLPSLKKPQEAPTPEVAQKTERTPLVMGNKVVDSGVDQTQKLQINFGETMRGIRALRGTELSQEKIAELHGFLVDSEIPTGWNKSQYRVLVNIVLNELRQQGDQQGLVRVLSQMCNDENQDVVVRDYALQHQAAMMDRLLSEERVPMVDAGNSTVTENIPQLKQQIEEALWQSTETTEGTVGGTALLALEDMSSRLDYWEATDEKRAKVTQLAVEMANNAQASDVARVTALQVAARGESGKNVLPVARELAQSQSNLALRLSAIAALGYQGTSEDRELLATLANQGDKRLKVAAEAALKRMDRRNGA